MSALATIKIQITTHPVVLYMKGTADFPMCGFSGKAVHLLQQCGVSAFEAINVLDDEEIRSGIKEFSQWPTVPQLYIEGKFIGGSDIMTKMYESGELQALLKPFAKISTVE